MGRRPKMDTVEAIVRILAGLTASGLAVVKTIEAIRSMRKR